MSFQGHETLKEVETSIQLWKHTFHKQTSTYGFINNKEQMYLTCERQSQSFVYALIIQNIQHSLTSPEGCLLTLV